MGDQPPLSAEVCDPSGGGGCNPGNVGGLPAPGPGAQPPSSSNRCCLDADTSVRMSDGSSKAARDIEVGDEVVGVASSGDLATQTVVSLTSSTESCVSVKTGDGEVICSKSHLFVNFCGDVIRADEVQVGHLLRSFTGKPIPVLEVSAVGERTVHLWECRPDHTFFAADLLHHNKAIIPVEAEETTSF